MKKSAVICFVIFCMIASGSAFALDMKSYCKQVASVAGGSYRIEETCLKQEQAAKDELEKMTVPDQIAKHCKEVAEVGGSG